MTLRSFVLAISCFALLAGGPATAANQRTYQGQEAAALRCANMLALTAVSLAGVKLISQQDKDIMLGVTVLILERHVSGSWAQKKAALKIMQSRRSLPDTLDDYQQNAAKCLRQFPIN
ncbi:MAG: ribosome biogenesis protein Tsr3 [Sulfitobacter sp.]